MTNPPVSPTAGGAHANADAEAARLIEESIESVREALTGLRFGNVSLTVHDGRVVQIDVTARRRLRPN